MTKTSHASSMATTTLRVMRDRRARASAWVALGPSFP
jgi:hypothetical protein